LARTEERSFGLLSPRERVLALQPLLAADNTDVTAVIELAAFGEEVRFGPGELILEGSDSEPFAYFITEGTVAVQYHEAGISRLMEAPGVVGTVNRFSRVGICCSARAQEDVVALRIPFDRLFQIIVRYTSVALMVASRLAEAVSVNQYHMPLDPYAVESPTLIDAGLDRRLDDVDCLLSVRHSGLFQPSSADAVGSLIRYANVMHAEAGEEIWVEGEQPNELLFVIDGGLRAVTTRSVPDLFIGARRSVGALSQLLRQQPVKYSVRTEVDTILLCIDGAGARAVLEDHSNFLFDMIGLLSRLLLSLPESFEEARQLVESRRHLSSFS
jgi:CRP-like cAMP-binding protein